MLEVEIELLVLDVLMDVLCEVEEVDTEDEVEEVLIEVEVEMEELVELVDVVVAAAEAKSSTVEPDQPELVPPTETVCKLQEATPALVSCPAVSPAPTSSTTLVIPVGAVSNVVSVERCPANPATQEVPVPTVIVRAG